jgi:uncharacterized protein (DUF2267 family)
MDDRTFFRKLSERMRCDERRAEALTFAVFQELRDRLTPAEANDVAAQLPHSLKMLWQSFDRPGRAVRRVHARQFIGEVRQIAALPDDDEAERAVLAVFGALQELLGSPRGQGGEAWDIMSQLPMDLKRLWLAASEAGKS